MLVEVVISPLEEAMASLLGVSLASGKSSEPAHVMGTQLRVSPVSEVLIVSLLVEGMEPDVSLGLVEDNVGGTEPAEVAAESVHLAGVISGLDDVANGAVAGAEFAEVGRSIRLAIMIQAAASLKAFLCMAYSSMRYVPVSGLSFISSWYSTHRVFSISSSALATWVLRVSRAVFVMD